MGSCPVDEELAAFVEGRLGPDARERLEGHLAACRDCLDVVAATLPSPATLPTPVAESTVVAAPAPVRAVPASVPSRLRRFAVAAGLVLLGGGLVLGLAQRPLLAHLAPRLSSLATRWLGTTLHADAVALRLGTKPGTFEVTLRGTQIGKDLRMFAKADEVGATVALSALVSGDPAITQLRVVGPVVELAGPGSLRLKWSAKERAQALALLAQTERLDVAEGRLVVRGPSGESFVIDHVAGGLERTEGGAKIVLQGQAAGGSVDVVGTLAKADAALALVISGRGLDAAAIPVMTQRVTGAAELRIDVTSDGDALRLDGRIAVRQGRVVGRGPTQLLGLDGEAKASLASLAPTLAGDDLAFDEARAMFAWRHGTWRLPRIYLAAGGTIAGGRARLDANGDVTGHGTLRLPSDVAAGLAARTPVLATFRDGSGAATVPFGVAGRLDTPRFTLGRP
jgi:hypothetical protein